MLDSRQQCHDVGGLPAECSAFQVALLADGVPQLLDPPGHQIGKFCPHSIKQFQRLAYSRGDRYPLIEGLDSLPRQRHGLVDVRCPAHEHEVKRRSHRGVSPVRQILCPDDSIGSHVLGVDSLTRFRDEPDEAAESFRLPLPVIGIRPAYQHPEEVDLPGVERRALEASADALQPMHHGFPVHRSVRLALVHQPQPCGLSAERPTVDILGDRRRSRCFAAGAVKGDVTFDGCQPVSHVVVFPLPD